MGKSNDFGIYLVVLQDPGKLFSDPSDPTGVRGGNYFETLPSNFSFETVKVKTGKLLGKKTKHELLLVHRDNDLKTDVIRADDGAYYATIMDRKTMPININCDKAIGTIDSGFTAGFCKSGLMKRVCDRWPDGMRSSGYRDPLKYIVEKIKPVTLRRQYAIKYLNKK